MYDQQPNRIIFSEVEANLLCATLLHSQAEHAWNTWTMPLAIFINYGMIHERSCRAECRDFKIESSKVHVVQPT